MSLDGADGGLDSGDGMKVRRVHDVDKIVAIFLSLLFVTPLMYTVLRQLSDRIFDMIVSGGL